MTSNTQQMTLLSHSIDKTQAINAQINYFEQDEAERVPLETFINRCYQKYYQVTLDHFYPTLLSIEEPEQRRIKAVAGLRSAAEETLFSEYYLEQSLQSELKTITNQSISRQYIVEIGNLAPASVGQMRWLIASITAFLYAAGFQYIVVTIVPGIYNAFKRMDISLTKITDAKQNCLPKAMQKKWGNDYYQLNPAVYVGDIVTNYKIMKENIYQTNKKLIPFFEKAYQSGLQYQLAHKIGEAA
jgi:hypothetical protein